MADTLAQLEVRVRRYLHEANADTSFWGRNFVRQLINSAYRRRCTHLIMAFEGWFVNIATRDIEANKAQYAFPDGFTRMQKVELVRSDGRTIPLQRYERHYEANPAQGESGDQFLPNYRLIGNGLILEPTPIETVTGGLRMEYTGTPVELTADGDSMHVSFPQIFEELVVLDAAVYSFDAELAQESGAIRSLLRVRAEWDDDWLRFIDQRSISRSEVEQFVPHYEDA